MIAIFERLAEEQNALAAVALKCNGCGEVSDILVMHKEGVDNAKDGVLEKQIKVFAKKKSDAQDQALERLVYDLPQSFPDWYFGKNTHRCSKCRPKN